MKKLTTILAFTLISAFYILHSSFTYAHLAGQPPFFKINGIYTNLYPVPLTSLEDFNLPQDIAPANYLVGQELILDFDMANLPAPPEVIKKTKFFWDFGDGETGKGLSLKHTYKKPGSYFMVIKVDDGSVPEPQLLQSTLLNILPTADYQLPKAVIKVNGKTTKDPLVDILTFNFNKPLNFDATSSESPNTKIVSYTWDFGDMLSATQAKTTHQYTTDQNQVFPVLRIKDSNGFIADAYLEVKNGLNADSYTTPNEQSEKKNTLLRIPFILGAGFLVLIAIYFKFGRKKKSKH